MVTVVIDPIVNEKIRQFASEIPKARFLFFGFRVNNHLYVGDIVKSSSSKLTPSLKWLVTPLGSLEWTDTLDMLSSNEGVFAYTNEILLLSDDCPFCLRSSTDTYSIEFRDIRFALRAEEAQNRLEDFVIDSEAITVKGPRFCYTTDKPNEYPYYPIHCGSSGILPLSDLIRNPHRYLDIATFPNDSLCVFGDYHYYHYSLDPDCNDVGWGCAYRSIQTILSWFLYNYPSLMKYRNVLSIIQIQQRLKEIDYAHADMVVGSSKAWIGCIEAAALLHDQTREEANRHVQGKILHATSIDQLEEILTGHDCRKHFTFCGSPIMVGAGDYAYTVIGISVKSKKVLILDPHCQSNDPSVAIKKGFIQWKSIRSHFSFKQTNAAVRGFINVCIPQIV